MLTQQKLRAQLAGCQPQGKMTILRGDDGPHGWLSGARNGRGTALAIRAWKIEIAGVRIGEERQQGSKGLVNFRLQPTVTNVISRYEPEECTISSWISRLCSRNFCRECFWAQAPF